MWVTEAMIDRALDALREEAELPYGAHIANFTDEQIRAGELRRADLEAEKKNRVFIRRVLEEALRAYGPLPPDPQDEP